MMQQPPPNRRLPSRRTGNRFIIACVAGSFLVHGVAYGMLRTLRKPQRLRPPTEERIALPPKPKRAAPRSYPVRIRKPRPSTEVTPPMRVRPRAVSRRQPQKIKRRRATPKVASLQPLDLRTPSAGVNPNLTSVGGTEAVAVGDTGLGDPNVAPSKVRRRKVVAPTRSAPTPMVAPKPVARVVTLKQLPRVIRVPRVGYPSKARQKRIEGTVKLQVTVARTGRVSRIKVLRGLGYGLDQAAVRALRKARFRPAVGSDGKPMTYTIRYRYTFRLEE